MSRLKPTILLADDSPANIGLMEMVLGTEYEILVAVNGEEAVELALAETPDLILLDVMMPKMDGYEACRRLKADRRTADIPVIFVTALDQEGEETKGLELGAIDFIAKPIRPAVVKARVRNHLELKQQRDILAGLSFLDGLTGIANRRKFDQVLEMEWRRGVRSELPLSLILMDIDLFKLFNDAEGHLAGDDCLRKVAQALAGVIQRPGDLAARYGGEEFGCILAETDATGARLVAERIQAGIRELGLRHPNSSVSPMVTLSLGIATCVPSLAFAADGLIETADKAMYAAKHAGRNQVACAGG